MQEKEVTFEEALKKLVDAVSKLENGEIQLDEAFKMFEEFGVVSILIGELLQLILILKIKIGYLFLDTFNSFLKSGNFFDWS